MDVSEVDTSERRQAELSVEMKAMNYHHSEPPPSYNESEGIPEPRPIIQDTVTVQPQREPLKSLKPVQYYCPSCRKHVLTKVEYSSTRNTHLLAGFIFGCTMWCMACCLAATPYVLPIFQNSLHFCPTCGKFLGSHSKL